jgi:transglutaminase superfamily protein
MRRLLKFLRLSMHDKALLLMALLLVCIMRAGLWLAPFDRMRRWSGQLSKKRSRTVVDCPQKLASAVELAARFVPRASCLTQALAAQVLLSRAGYEPLLRLGVNPAGRGHFKAHAWVECRGKILIGEIPSLSEFTPLPTIASK